MVEHLPSICEALGSNTNTEKNSAIFMVDVTHQLCKGVAECI
jgi:hypothetical protein